MKLKKLRKSEGKRRNKKIEIENFLKYLGEKKILSSDDVILSLQRNQEKETFHFFFKVRIQSKNKRFLK